MISLKDAFRIGAALPHTGSKMVLHRVILLVMLLSCAGCYTQPMWRDATRRHLTGPFICGRVPAEATGAGDAWLLKCETRSPSHHMFAIHLLPSHEYYYLMPLGEDGVPLPPFRIATAEREWMRIEKGLTREEVEAVQVGPMQYISTRRARKLMQRPGFEPPSPARIQSADKFVPFRRTYPLLAVLPQESASATAILPSPTTESSALHRATTNPILAPDAAMVLLPTGLRRPTLNRYLQTSAAVVLTPVTAIVDGVTIAGAWVGLGLADLTH
jgi:hypothetical protein